MWVDGFKTLYNALPWRSTKTFTVVWWANLELRGPLVLCFGYVVGLGVRNLGLTTFFKIFIFSHRNLTSPKISHLTKQLLSLFSVGPWGFLAVPDELSPVMLEPRGPIPAYGPLPLDK